MKWKLFPLLGSLCLILTLIPTGWAGHPAGLDRPAGQIRGEGPKGDPPAPTAHFRDDFDDTAGLEEYTNLVAEGGRLQVRQEVAWTLDTLEDFDPGSGRGVDLYTEPGTIRLSRFTPDVRVNDVPTGTQVQPDTAFYAQIGRDVPYVYAVWADGRAGDLDIYFSRSTDGGVTWSAGRQLNLVDSAGDQHDPAIAARGGSVHVVWEDGDGVHHTRSQDCGATWLTDRLLAAGGSAPAVAAARVGSDNLVYVLYVAEEDSGDPDLFSLRSQDDGTNWGAPEDVVPDEPAGAVQAHPSAGLPVGHDKVWAAWVDDRDGEDNLYAGWRAGPNDWNDGRVDEGPEGSVQSQPALFFRGTKVTPYVLWTDDRAGPTELFWGEYIGDALTWEEHGALTGPGSGAHGAAVAPVGSATWAGWLAAPPADLDTVWLQRYNGTTWEAPLLAPDHRPGVSRSGVSVVQADVAGQTVAALWSDDRHDGGDVWVSTSDGGYQDSGTYTSTVRYFGPLNAWGPISWTGSPLGWVTVEVRSGDTPTPDLAWSPWISATNGAPAPVPPAPYLQLRVTLQRVLGGDTPALDSLHVAGRPRYGWGMSVPFGSCVAAWDTFEIDGYAVSGTTMTLNVLDISGTVIYSDVTAPFDLSGIDPARYPRLRLGVDMERSLDDSPFINWWQVAWQEGENQAAFTFEPAHIYTPTVVHLTNHSTGTVEPAFLWDFGDGITSTLAHPTHTYTAPGTYTVTLIAYGECAPDVATATLLVRSLPEEPPVAAFSTGPLCPGEVVTFTNESSGAIWWHWAFGDGGTSTHYSPTHVYTTAGDYSATLAVTNTHGSDRAGQLLAVRPAPTVDFDWVADLLTMTFVATATGDPALAWDFGDGSTGPGLRESKALTTSGACGQTSSWMPCSPAAGPTACIVTHTYEAAGAYTVTLTATNACDRAVVRHAIAVTSCRRPGGLAVSYPTGPITVGTPAVFSATVATGTAPLEFAWDMGEGAPALEGAAVVHTYTDPGRYTVTLVVSNNCGQARALLTVEVVAGPGPPDYRIHLPAAYRGFYGGDSFEPDDAPDQATLLALDDPQAHDFYPQGDADWVYLELEAGVAYTIETYDLEGGADTWIYLYAAGRYDEPAAANDDCSPYTRGSCITYSPLVSGRYELKVANITGSWGREVGYLLEATAP